MSHSFRPTHERASQPTAHRGHTLREVPPLPASPPSVVVIVLNWCGEADTVACLRSIERDAYPGAVVLLVDNGSPDGSGERLRKAFPAHPYLQTGGNLGFTGGNNSGLEWAMAAGAEFAVVLNNDTIVEPGCIAQLVATARAEPGVGAVAPKIVAHDEPERLWYAGGELLLARGAGRHHGFGDHDSDHTDDGRDAPRDVSFISGCCLLLTRPALQAVAGFDDGYFAYNEDVDLSFRLRKAGFQLLYAPRARIAHKVPPFDAEPTPWQIAQRDRNRRRFVRLRLGAWERARFALWFYPTRLLHAVRYAARRDWTRVRAIWDGMAR